MAAMEGKLDAQNDSTQARAHEIIDNDHLGESFAAEAERSVFDEPTYSREMAGEVPENAITYQRFLQGEIQETTKIQSWFTAAVIAMASGLFAIAGSFVTEFGNVGLTGSVQFLAIAVFAPVVEEVMKTALILWYVEQKPYVFRSAKQIVLVGMISGLVFAAVENALYLMVYIDEPSAFIIIWRWTVCVVLHVGATLIASIGLVKIWRRVIATGNFARAEIGAPYLFFAILFHGIYNGCMYIIGVLGAF